MNVSKSVAHSIFNLEQQFKGNVIADSLYPDENSIYKTFVWNATLASSFEGDMPDEKL